MTPHHLRQARKELGMTQAQFAEALSDGNTPPINVQTVRNWEAGKNPVPSLMRRAIIALRQELKQEQNQ